jgi:hypothetical protein
MQNHNKKTVKLLDSLITHCIISHMGSRYSDKTPNRNKRPEGRGRTVCIIDPEVVALIEAEMTRTQQKTLARTAANVIRRALYSPPTPTMPPLPVLSTK